MPVRIGPGAPKSFDLPSGPVALRVTSYPQPIGLSKLLLLKVVSLIRVPFSEVFRASTSWANLRTVWDSPAPSFTADDQSPFILSRSAGGLRFFDEVAGVVKLVDAARLEPAGP